MGICVHSKIFELINLLSFLIQVRNERNIGKDYDFFDLGSDFEKTAKFGRSRGPNKRSVGAINEIGIHSIRAGDIVGDHTVLYAGPGERIELKHQAHSRECFAEGAIKAIKFIAMAKENKIYSTSEVLGL